MMRPLRQSVWWLGVLFGLVATMETQAVVRPSLPDITLDGERGGLVQGKAPWSNRDLLGRLQLVIYVDPDDHTLNDELIQRLRAQKYTRDQLSSTAIINLAASWKPNAVILSILRGKQEEFPDTTYVFDRKQSIAKAWNLPLDGYHVMLVDRDGSVLFEKAGKLEKREIDEFLELVKLRVAANSSPKLADPGQAETKKSL